MSAVSIAGLCWITWISVVVIGRLRRWVGSVSDVLWASNAARLVGWLVVVRCSSVHECCIMMALARCSDPLSLPVPDAEANPTVAGSASDEQSSRKMMRTNRFGFPSALWPVNTKSLTHGPT